MTISNELEFKGTLRIDRGRGVVYFDDDVTGRSVLRVSGIPIEATVGVTKESGLLDITDHRSEMLQPLEK
jgi:hypothetical protein